jgi:hypothetical protein
MSTANGHGERQEPDERQLQRDVENECVRGRTD